MTAVHTRAVAGRRVVGAGVDRAGRRWEAARARAERDRARAVPAPGGDDRHGGGDAGARVGGGVRRARRCWSSIWPPRGCTRAGSDALREAAGGRDRLHAMRSCCGPRRRPGRRRWNASRRSARLRSCASSGWCPARRAGASRAWRRRSAAALHVPGDHAIDPEALVGALVAAIERAGGRDPMRRARSRGSRSAAPRARGGARAGGETMRRRARRGCRGLGSGAARRPGPASARVPLRPVKGQLLRLRDGAGPGLVELRPAQRGHLPGPARRRPLRAGRDGRGARGRHHRHRGRGLRAAARGDRARAGSDASWRWRACGPGCDRRRPTTRRRSAAPRRGTDAGPPATSATACCSRRSPRGALASIAGAEPPRGCGAVRPARFAPGGAGAEPGVAA